MTRVSVEMPVDEATDVTESTTPDSGPPPNNPTPPAVTPAPAPPHRSRLSLKRIVLGVIVLAALIVAFLILQLTNDRKELQQEVDRLSNRQAAAEDEAEQLKQEVGQLIELPADESPTIATVVDANKVKNQSFFANTQNGDKVLLFPKAGKAILYRPSTKKIIEVAPINLGNNEAQPSTPTQP